MALITGMMPFPIQTYSGLGFAKQSLLICDKIGYLDITPHIGMLRRITSQYPYKANIANELEYLIQKELLIETLKPNERVVFPTHLNEEVISLGGLISQLEARLALYTNPEEGISDYIAFHEARARLASLCHTSRDGTLAVPLLRQLARPPQERATKSDIIKVILNKLPLPDEKTPWEKILDFKNNPDNRGRLAKLNVWMNKALSSNQSVTEINDEIEALLYEYRKSLELHKIKYGSGILESLVVGSAELLENLSKFRLGNVAKSSFSFRKQKAELYNAELTAPGNALAYIHSANETFRPS